MKCDQCNISHQTKLCIFKDPNAQHAQVVRLCQPCYTLVNEEMKILGWELGPWERVKPQIQRVHKKQKMS